MFAFLEPVARGDGGSLRTGMIGQREQLRCLPGVGSGELCRPPMAVCDCTNSAVFMCQACPGCAGQGTFSRGQNGQGSCPHSTDDRVTHRELNTERREEASGEHAGGSESAGWVGGPGLQEDSGPAVEDGSGRASWQMGAPRFPRLAFFTLAKSRQSRAHPGPCGAEGP